MQVFGVGITQITSLLARRSVYCSKHANGQHSIAKSFASDEGNIWFKRLKHSWDGDKCKYCGANRRDYDRDAELETHAYAFIHSDNIKTRLAEIFGGNMQFDVIIGNPPYQLGQSGGEAVGGFAMPIYQKFVQAAKSLDPRFVVMVTPARWYAGGRGLDEYRSEMLADKRIRALVDYPDAAEAFPGIQIKGGVSYFLWDNSWNDACEVTTIEGGKPTGPPTRRYLSAYDVLVRRNEAVPILEKVLKVNAKDGFGSLASKVSPIQPFSIRTNFRGAPTPKGIKNPVRLIGNGGESFIARADVPRNDAWIDEWKVLLGAAYGAGEGYPHQIYNHPIVAGPGTACSETYLVIDRFNSKVEAERFATYLRTRLARFLVSLRKNTQHLYNERFQFVPVLPMDREWTDEMLYKKYGITKAEIAFIESMIRPMGESDE
jgi:site-specific DNA-methyltransferase (adenine-specific)